MRYGLERCKEWYFGKSEILAKLISILHKHTLISRNFRDFIFLFIDDIFQI